MTERPEPTQLRRPREESLLDILATIMRWWKQIALVCAITFVLACVVALLMPNYYESTTVVFPTDPSSSKRGAIYGDQELRFFGLESDVDRLLAIAQSNALANSVIDSFDLYEHYDINPDGGYKAQAKVMTKFYSRYTVKRSEFGAVEMGFEDQDRELAARVLTGIVNTMDSQNKSLINGEQLKIISMLGKDIEDKEKLLIFISDSLANVRKRYSIYSVDAQSEALALQVTTTESSLAESKARLEAFKTGAYQPRDSIRKYTVIVKSLQSKLDNMTSPTSTSQFNINRFNKGANLVKNLERRLAFLSESLAESRAIYDQTFATSSSTETSLRIVQAPEVPVEKSRPKRSILVLGVTFLVFVFCIAALLIYENVKHIDWGSIARGER